MPRCEDEWIMFIKLDKWNAMFEIHNFDELSNDIIPIINY